MHTRQTRDGKTNWWKILFSVLASFVGVQTSENHEADSSYIEKTGFMPYVIVSLVMTALLVALIYGLVQIILSGQP